MQISDGTLLNIIGFIIITLISIVAFAGKRFIKGVDEKLIRAQSWYEHFGGQLLQIKERVDEVSFENKTNSGMIQEVMKDVSNIRDVQTRHADKISELEKQILVQVTKHNEIHPLNKL